MKKAPVKTSPGGGKGGVDRSQGEESANNTAISSIKKKTHYAEKNGTPGKGGSRGKKRLTQMKLREILFIKKRKKQWSDYFIGRGRPSEKAPLQRRGDRAH